MGLGIVKRSEFVTVEELKKKFPAKKNVITQEIADYLNETMSNPSYDSGTFLDTLVDFQDAMLTCKVGIKEYVNAIKFCGFLEHEKSAVAAYKKARMGDQFVRDRRDAPTDSADYADLVSAANRYRKSKLVRQILTQSELPIHFIFQAERIKAVNVLAKEMEEAKYSKDRINAAKELLAATKGPDQQRIELEVGPNAQAVELQTQLFEQIRNISQIQQKRLESGSDITDVQVMNISTEFKKEEDDG